MSRKEPPHSSETNSEDEHIVDQETLQANLLTAGFFALPVIDTDPEYRDVGNTKVSWTPGYFRFIEFVPWNDFEIGIWGKAMKKFREMDLVVKDLALSRLEMARGMINHGNNQGRNPDEDVVASVSEDAEDEEDIEPSEMRRINGNVVHYWTNSASISPVTGNVSMALEGLYLGYLALDNKESLYNIRCAKERSITTGDIRNERGEKLLVTMQQNIVADISLQLDLFTSRKKRKTPSAYFTRILPLCNFETKGPTLDLSGIDASRRWLEKQKASQKNSRGHSSTEGSTELQEIDSLVDPPVEPLPTGPEVYTPAEVAANFNFLFSDLEFLNTSNRSNGSLRDSIYRVSQTVTNAVLSLGGCAFLHNMKTGIGFKVKERNEKHLVVQVTGLLRSDTAPNCVSAMFAIGAHCIDSYFSQQGETLPSKVIDVASAVSQRATTLPNNAKQQDDSVNPPDGDSRERDREGRTSVGHAQAIISFEAKLGSGFMSLVLD